MGKLKMVLCERVKCGEYNMLRSKHLGLLF